MGGEQLPGQADLFGVPANRARTIGRSPEMPNRQRADCPAGSRPPTAGAAAGPSRRRRRATPAAGTGGPPRATSRGGGARPGCGPGQLEGPRDRRWPRGYWSARASASSRESATAVVNATTADPPGSSRTRRRRLKTGSSTGPVVPESARAGLERGGIGRRAAAAEEAGPVGLRVRSSTDAPAPPGRRRRRAPPRPAAGRATAAGGGRARPPSREAIPSRGTACRRPGGPGRRRAGQHDLGVAGQLQLARPRVVVGEREPADLGGLLRRDGHFQNGLDLRRRAGGSVALSAAKITS